MLHESLGDDLGHDLVGVVDALATLKSQREGEGVGEVGRIGGSELVGVQRAPRVAAPAEQSKNVASRRSFYGRLLLGLLHRRLPPRSSLSSVGVSQRWFCALGSSTVTSGCDKNWPTVWEYAVNPDNSTT